MTIFNSHVSLPEGTSISWSDVTWFFRVDPFFCTVLEGPGSKEQPGHRCSLAISDYILANSKEISWKCVYTSVYTLYIYIYTVCTNTFYNKYSSYTCCTLSILIRDAPKKSHAPTIHSRLQGQQSHGYWLPAINVPAAAPMECPGTTWNCELWTDGHGIKIIQILPNPNSYSVELIVQLLIQILLR